MIRIILFFLISFIFVVSLLYLINNRKQNFFWFVLLWFYALQNLLKVVVWDHFYISNALLLVGIIILFYKKIISSRPILRATSLDVLIFLYICISAIYTFIAPLYDKGDILLEFPLVTAHGSFKIALLGFFYNTRFFWAYFLVRLVFTNENNEEFIVKNMNFIILLVALIGILQYYTKLWDKMLFLTTYKEAWDFPFKRVYSFLLNFWDVSMVLCIGAALQINKIFQSVGNISKVKVIMNLLIILICLLFTYTRSAWGIVFSFIGVYFFLNIRCVKSKIYFYSIFLIIISLIFISLNPTLGERVNTILQMRDPLGSIEGHMEAFMNGVKMFISNPIGYGNGTCSFARRFEQEVYFIPESWIMQIFVETGLFGGIIFFLIIGYILFSSWIISKKKLNFKKTDMFYFSSMIFSLTFSFFIFSFVAQHTFLGNMNSAYFFILVGIWQNKILRLKSTNYFN